MKIGIMTWFQYQNYGTALQAVALNEILKRNGHNPYIINYYTTPIVPGLKFSGNIIKKAYTIYEKIKKLGTESYESEQKRLLFNAFFEKHVVFTKLCETTADLSLLNNFLDCFICGSDQIWSPSCFDSHYFLDFVDEPDRAIAYAPSICIPGIEECYIADRIATLTNRITNISVREKTGAKGLSALTNKPVKVTLDPTLMLDCNDWNTLIPVNKNEVGEGRYLLAYFLGKNEKHWKSVYKIAKRLSLPVKIIPVFKCDIQREGCIKSAIGPEEFVRLIRNAGYICTDSYHGMIFSVIYKKQFSVYKRFSKLSSSNQNSRVFELLDSIQLKDHIFNRSHSKKYCDATKFDSAFALLESRQKESAEFLMNSLNRVSEFNNSHPINKRNSVDLYSKFCCGCGGCMTVCSSGAITMSLNEDGFISAGVDNEKCCNCGKCISVCPLINPSNFCTVKDGTLYSYKDYRETVLLKSSSGGAAFALGEVALNEGFAVIGCKSSTGVYNPTYELAESKSDLSFFQGSKYLQSCFSPVLTDLLTKRNKTAVFGLPCQIAATRNIYGDRDNIYIDLICHGVPSLNLYKRYAEHLQSKHGIDPQKMLVDFRYKPKGWRERHLFASDGIRNVCLPQNKDLFYLFFESRNCYAKACYECPWRNKSAADIRIGDYWGPRFSEDKTGVSMLLSLTPSGEKIVSLLSKQETGNVSVTDINDYLLWQDTINIAEPSERDEVIKSLRSRAPLSKSAKTFVFPEVRVQTIKKTAKKILGIKK